MKLDFSEEMWHFFSEESELSSLAKHFGYDLHDPNAVPKAILQ